MTPNKPRLVGLTGGIACGKSSLADALRQHGATVIDADAISRELTAPGGAALDSIRRRFGEGVFADGKLDRGKLGRIVFRDPEALAGLNRILHPMVFARMDEQIRAHSHEAALVADVPLLYETGYDKACDEVWCAWAPPAAQLKRLLERGLSPEEARSRINSQMSAMEQARRADRVIITTGDIKLNARAVQTLWDEMIRRTSSV